LGNVHFSGYQPLERLPEVLATGDIHIVPLKSGLGTVSVPSKTYSILAAGRPVLAAIDPGTEVPRIIDAAHAGISVGPDDPLEFRTALQQLIDDPTARDQMGVDGRQWVEGAASPASIARMYAELIVELNQRR
jgi:colanic acid biosynthesis glycosyl transferase WcaI